MRGSYTVSYDDIQVTDRGACGCHGGEKWRRHLSSRYSRTLLPATEGHGEDAKGQGPLLLPGIPHSRREL